MLDTLLNETVTGDKDSAALNLEHTTGYSIQANVAAFTTITFNLEVSNDGLTYTTISGQQKVSTSAETLFWDVTDQYAEYVRVAITLVTGSGNVEIISKKKPC